MAEKRRLDLLLLERRLAPSRSKAAALIMAAQVSVNGRLVDKPGTMIRGDAVIDIKSRPRYVGRGGYKLEAALKAFAIDPTGKVCADVGASTGGFTDCLLQHGAAKVYAIDVGRGILDYGLRIDERVVPLENTNARYLESLAEAPDLVAVDVSFISLRLILPAVARWIDSSADVIALVKPQFEAGKADIGKGGIVRRSEVRRDVLLTVAEFAESAGFSSVDILHSPLAGAKGNIEYLLWLRLEAAATDIRARIETLFLDCQ